MNASHYVAHKSHKEVLEKIRETHSTACLRMEANNNQIREFIDGLKHPEKDKQEKQTL